MILMFLAGFFTGIGLAVIAAYLFLTWDNRAIRAYNGRAKAVPACLHGKPVNSICTQCYDQEMVGDFLDKLSQSGPLT